MQYPIDKDLFSLTLVSKLLKSEAERVIFHTVTLPLLAILRTGAIFERIASPGPIASYIHRLEVHLAGFDAIGWGVSYKQLISGIQKMSNLREMQYFGGYNSPSGFLDHLAENVTFRLDGLATSSSFSGLDNFLRSQSSLRILKWSTGDRCAAPVDMAPSFSLPNLRTLAVDYSENIAPFLQQFWVSRLQIANLDLDAKVEVMPSVVSLQINFWAMVSSGSPIETLARVFPNLQFLDLIWSHDLVSYLHTFNPQSLFRLMCVIKISQNSLHRLSSKLFVSF